jgi:hypothetical protein
MSLEVGRRPRLPWAPEHPWGACQEPSPRRPHSCAKAPNSIGTVILDVRNVCAIGATAGPSSFIEIFRTPPPR